MLALSSRAAARSLPSLSRRGFASKPLAGFDAVSAAGVQVAGRDVAGPTASIALVARAGTRYSAPGLAEGLEKFAFRNTTRRSALRIVREVELLGGELSASYGRETVVLGARFLREDLPYFVELLAETVSAAKYQNHELAEEVVTVSKLAHEKFLSNPAAVALDAAHSVAFHRGLGSPLVAGPGAFAPGVTADAIADYAQTAFTKENIAVVCNGVGQDVFAKWSNNFFPAVRSGAKAASAQSQYYGGQQRIASTAGNAIVIAFPGSSSPAGSGFKPESEVLARVLGGGSSIKWTAGFSLLAKVAAKYPGVQISTANHGYSDAGLLAITIAGEGDVAGAAKETAAVVLGLAKGVEKETVDKAIAYSKFAISEAGLGFSGAVQAGTSVLLSGSVVAPASVDSGIAAVKAAQVQSAAKALVAGKVSYVAVGNVHELPFAEDLGLRV